jgi:Sec-independent protein secretion pathway component TatC
MVTQTLLALPMLGLYLLGVVVAFFFGRQRRRAEAPAVSEGA